MKCEKKGCLKEGNFLVHLEDPDGEMEWRACERHMIAFQAWCADETARQGGDLVSALVVTHAERSS